MLHARSQRRPISRAAGVAQVRSLRGWVPVPTLRADASGQVAEAAKKIIEIIVLNEGCYDIGSPGEVLYNLANDAEVSYPMTSRGLLMLEALGTVHVTRHTYPYAWQSNRIVKVEAQ